MPLELPNLDDLTYDELVTEAIRTIPNYAPEWTNHNPADPGITLIELFAYLSEMLLYRQNRVTDKNVCAFLKLLNGTDWTQNKELLYGRDWCEKVDLREEVRLAVLGVRDRYRAVTCEDFEELAKEADARITCVRCVPKRNLELEDPAERYQERSDRISMIVVPHSNATAQLTDIINVVKQDLEPRRLLTTKIHVVGPRYLTVRVRLTIALKDDIVEDKFQFGLTLNSQSDLDSNNFSASLRQQFENSNISTSGNITISVEEPDKKWLLIDEQLKNIYIVRKEVNELNAEEKLNVYQDIIRTKIIESLKQFVDPKTDTSEPERWSFGRNLYISEIYELLDKMTEIDYVENTNDQDELIVSDSQRLLFHASGELVGVELKLDELVDIPLSGNQIAIKSSIQSS